MNEILNAIGQYGFSIVMCLVEAWYIYYLQNTHAKETDNLRTVIEQNTIAITKLYEKISAIDESGDKND